MPHVPSSILRTSRRHQGLLITVTLLAAFVLVSPSALQAGECARQPGAADAWRLEAHDLDALHDDVGSPQTVEFRTGRPADDEGAYESVAHMHMLVDVEARVLADVLRDVERQPDFMPRLVHANVICSELEEEGFLRVEQELSFRILIFRRDYRYVIDYFIEDDVDEAGAFRVWWALSDPGDGQIVTNSGSWYVRRVEIDGSEYSYLAYGVHTVFARRQAGLRTALRRFGERDVRNAMEALYEEAARRES